MNQELSTTESKRVEQAAKDYAKQKFNSEHFRESCAKHFTGGASFATTSPDILREILRLFCEFIRKDYWMEDANFSKWVHASNGEKLTDIQLIEKYILQTNKDKEDARP